MLYCFYMELFSLTPYRGLSLCVAVSGGRDSVALLHFLHRHAEEAHITLTALTCDHGIRAASASDVAFVRNLCEGWGIPLAVFCADVPARARESGRNLEEEGRLFRRECFARVLEDGADAVLTAHHRDDYAETVLFRLARGTSLAGLNVFPVQKGLLRPLLGVTRETIDEYIRENALPYVEDESNADLSYARNRIRHEVLPALERAVPGAKENLVRFSERAVRDGAFLEELARREVRGTGAERRIPVSLPEALFSRACLAAMKELGLVRDYTESHLRELGKLAEAQAGKRTELPAGLVAFREGGELVFVRRTPQMPAEELPFFIGRRAFLGGLLEAGEGDPGAAFGRGEEGTPDGRVLLMDLGTLPDGAVWRTRQEGDTFLACNGRGKTLKKFLTDRKIPARVGRELPVLAVGSEVLCVAGVELSDRIKRTRETARPGYICFTKKS